MSMRTKIGFVGYGNAAKGWNIVKKLIKKFPNEEFIVIGTKKSFKKGNVYYLSKGDMTIPFMACKIWLVPSQWQEAYGRISEEARLSGVPNVIVSNVGGLSETKPHILIDDYKDVKEWIRVVGDVLNG